MFIYIAIQDFYYLINMLSVFQTHPSPPKNQPIANQIITLVDQILSAKKQNPEADTSQLKKQIDQLVYKLYDLTEEEIKIIEGGYNE